jgi:hypothetical protein
VPIYNKTNNKRKDKRIIKIITPKICNKARLSASATVEASLVVPIFIFSVMAIMYLIQIVNIKQRMMQALYNDARLLSKYVYVYNKYRSTNSDQHQDELQQEYHYILEEGISLTLAKALLLQQLGDEFSKEANIVGGEAGICLWNSRFLENGRDIELNVSYTVRNPFDVFGLGAVTVSQSYTSAAWIGAETLSTEENSIDKNITEGDYVYITENGEVYHTDKTCTYLNPSIRAVDIEDIYFIRNLSGGKYDECERCAADYETQWEPCVYVTDYGTKFHAHVNCSSLKRVVIKVPRSEVLGWKACSKCGGSAYAE